MRNTKRPVDKQGKLDIIIYTHDVPKYFNRETIFFLNFWTRYKRYGNPWEIGWLKWPYWAIRVIEICDQTNEKLNDS